MIGVNLSTTYEGGIIQEHHTDYALCLSLDILSHIGPLARRWSLREQTNELNTEHPVQQLEKRAAKQSGADSRRPENRPKHQCQFVFCTGYIAQTLTFQQHTQLLDC
jgi:hypothetical protein